MLIFYNDLLECKKAIELLKKQRGASINSTLLPIQKDWEKHLEEVSDSIGADVTATLFRNRQIIMRSDIKLPQPFASWSNSL